MSPRRRIFAKVRQRLDIQGPMGPLVLAFTNEAFAPREDDLKAAGFRAPIDWSTKRLAPAERRILRRLTVFSRYG